MKCFEKIKILKHEYIVFKKKTLEAHKNRKCNKLLNASFTHLPLDPAPRSLKKAVLDLSERPPKLL